MEHGNKKVLGSGEGESLDVLFSTVLIVHTVEGRTNILKHCKNGNFESWSTISTLLMKSQRESIIFT